MTFSNAFVNPTIEESALVADNILGASETLQVVSGPQVWKWSLQGAEAATAGWALDHP